MSKKFNWTRILLSSASLAAMGVTPAMAQDDGEVSDEIVVTATGRTAALQDVPIAVTALGTEAIENAGVQDLRDIQQLAPSLSIGTGQSNSSGTIARIRGIGTGSDNPGFEAAVGIFIDGVYRARAGAAIADLPEVERVEVLRGPQGTLFGRNTSAGAISVITAGPEFTPGMWIEGRFGLDDLEEGGMKAGANIPLSDTLAFRVDGSIRARDGFITDLISGDDINTRDRWTTRAQAIWDISDDATLRFIVDAAGSDEVCCAAVPFVYGSTQGVISLLTAGAGTPAIDPEARNATITPGRGYGETTDELGFSAQLDWDLGFATLTSVTAQRNWEAERDQDVDFNLIDLAYRDGLEVEFDNFTQEFRLQGETGRLNWLVGVFYGDETLNTTDRIRIGTQTNLYANVISNVNTTYDLYNFSAAPSLFQAIALSPALAAFPAVFAGVNTVNPGPNAGHLAPNVAGSGQSADNWNVDTESLSVFTHNEFNISDNLVLTVGVRYNQETKDLSANLLSSSASCTTLQQMEAATDGIYAATGIVRTIETIDPDGPGPAPAGAFADLMNFSCNPAVNPIANGAWAGSSEENEWSGTASLAYHLSEDTMIYGGYSRGYKAGGYNVDRSGFDLRPSTINAATLNTGQLAFDPEFTDSYEIGLRTTILGSTTLNLTAFYSQIHDYQSNNFNGFNFVTRNVAEVVSQGIELDFRTRITDQFSIEGGVNYTDAYYDTTEIFNNASPAVAAENTIFSGDPLTFSPEWSATGAMTYVQPLGGNLQALFYVDARYTSEYRTQTLGRKVGDATNQEEMTLFNGRVGIGPDDDRWSVEFWGRNLTDEFYFVGAFNATLQNTTVIYPSEPRTYGVTLRARY